MDTDLDGWENLQTTPQNLGELSFVFHNLVLRESESNDSDSLDDEFIQSEEQFVYFALFFVPLVLVSNLIVSVSSFLMIFQRKDAKCSYVSLCNISTSNVIVCASVFIGFLEINYLNNKYICALQLGSILAGNITLMISILVLAVERYFYIVQGRKLDESFSSCRISLLVIAMWTLAFFFGLFPSIVEAGESPRKIIEACDVLNIPLTGVVASLVLTSLVGVATPVAYVWVYRLVRRSSMKMTNNCKIPKLKLKSILLVLVTSVTALALCLPYVVFLAWYKMLCQPQGMRCRGVEYAVASPLAILGFTYTLVNPLVYAWWHPPYSNALKNVFCSEARRARRQSLLQMEATKPIKTIS